MNLLLLNDLLPLGAKPFRCLAVFGGDELSVLADRGRNWPQPLFPPTARRTTHYRHLQPRLESALAAGQVTNMTFFPRAQGQIKDGAGASVAGRTHSVG